MATISQSPVNVSATATPISVLPFGQSTPYGTVVCTIYNSTSSILSVTCAGGTRFLQPSQADSYPTSNAFPVPTVVPITPLATGTYLGTITATFYDTNDGAPPGFPQPLTPFPGGLTLALFRASTASPGGAGINVAPPIGTTSLLFQNNQGTNVVITTVTGNNTGANYTPTNITIAPGAQQTIAVSALDTSFNIKTSVAFSGLVTIYASNIPISAISSSAAPVALPTPTGANLYLTATVGNGGQVLAAPTSGAYYVYGIDSRTAAADTQQFRDSSGADFASTFVSTAGEVASTPDLAGVRVPSSITYAAVAVAQNNIVTIRYSLGP